MSLNDQEKNLYEGTAEADKKRYEAENERRKGTGRGFVKLEREKRENTDG